MHHLPHLITDLGFIVIIAALSTLFFKRLGQPLVLGYLIAGFIVSPHVPFFPTVTEIESIKVWSEIGVIFLLFSLGLEFSFKKLFKVGGSAGFTSSFEVIFMIALGYGVGAALGWSLMDSLFFGGILAISSTTIIVKAFHELGMRGHKFVDIVFGILVVEDIIAILLLVVLTAIAGSDSFSGFQLLSSGIRLFFFIALWFLIGIFFIPLFLRKIRGLLEDEIMLLVSIGLCFLMVMVAAHVGFSAALGAFVMGSLLAETPEGRKMEHLLHPVKNLFAAIFFVSVGMMIDPTVIAKNWALILLVTVITIVGKFVSTFLGALLSGQPRKVAFQAGMSLAQIGEFSFIIASLGASLKVTSEFLYPLAISVSAVTTFTTPYLIKYTDSLYSFFESIIPEGVKTHLDRYHVSFSESGSQSVGALLFKTYGVKIILNSIVIVAILGAFVKFGESQEFFATHQWVAGAYLLLCLLVTAPFFWGIVMGGPNLTYERQLAELRKLKGLQAGLFVGRFLLALVLLTVLLSQFLTLQVASGVFVFVLFIAILLGKFLGKHVYQIMENGFLKNLTEKERQELEEMGVSLKLLPWDGLLNSFEIFPEASFVGRTLKEVSFKEKYGVTIAAVFRGSRRYFAPSGSFVLWPYDKIICFGNEDELQKFRLLLDEQKNRGVDLVDVADQDNFKLTSTQVTSDSSFKNRAIQDCGIRDAFRGMVVGVQRSTQRILGPSGEFVLREGDVLWIISDRTQT